MDRVTKLPNWLDSYIFDKLGAKYCRSNSDMTVIDWDRSDILNYLGTYFPRSFAESYRIFTKFFNENNNEYVEHERISIFDFGCGTGGEIIGLLLAILKNRRNIREINILAFDGNQHALRLYENIVKHFNYQFGIIINNCIMPSKIDDFYDLNIIDSVVGDRKFDFILSFKAVCEFVTKQCFEQNNPYKHIVELLLPKLTPNGIILLVDVTSYNDVSQEWLPNMMDNGLKDAGCITIDRNPCYNHQFKVSHSKNQLDVSKVAWRIIKK